MSQIKERPILMNGDMVRATLRDINPKTQTRRIIDPAPMMVTANESRPWEGDPAILMQLMKSTGRKCKYGQPGDRLYVRENFQPFYAEGREHGVDRPDWDTGEGYAPSYPATDGVNEFIDGDDNITSRVWPSIHMPRWASRIDLEITGLHVERLQDISEADAIAEGIECAANNYGNGPAYCDYSMKCPDDTTEWFASPIRSFQTLWESINGPGSWNANPWVWVVKFKRIEKEVAA